VRAGSVVAMLPLLQIDAFTSEAFAGNPAAVCFLDRARDDGWMQSVAAEMNLSETAFLLPSDGAWSLRWFTPSVEVALCGHATLASAHALWETGRLDAAAPARFETLSGALFASRAGDLIELDFPEKRMQPAEAPPGLLEALGVERAIGVYRNEFDFMVEVADEAAVVALAPKHIGVGELPARGVIVTAPAHTPGADFVSRFFAPGSGVDEDPVTGSSHCALAPFWGERFGRTELTGYQASRRGGFVHTRVVGDRVILGGHAVTVMRGELVC
jgi:PhzF family phenazine biosynthesis protein